MQSSTGLTDSANVVVNVNYPYSTEIVSGSLGGNFKLLYEHISRGGRFVAFAAEDADPTGDYLQEWRYSSMTGDTDAYTIRGHIRWWCKEYPRSAKSSLTPAL